MALESVGLRLLGSVAWEGLKGLWGYLFKYGPQDIEELKKKMEQLLQDLEYVSDLEDPAKQTDKWIADVRELVCDIEDVISKCKHPGDKRGNTDDKIKKKVVEIKERIMLTPTYFSLSGKIRQITDDAAGAENRYRKVNMALGGSRAEHHRYLPLRKQGSSGLKGIDRPREKIISLLDVPATPGDRFEKSIGHMVVSIVGVGGLGKTTLAGQVYNEIKEKFQCKALVFVSRNRPLKEILKTILQEFRVNHNLGDCEPMTLVELIQEHVQNKRFLVVFDDVWNDDLLENINIALFGNQRGGRIIITTRKNDVAKKWCSFHPMESNGCCSFEGNRMYQIKPLNEEDSRNLLLQKADSPCHLRRPQKFKEYIDKILAKCSGSPLALAAASDLAVEQEASTICWNKVYKSMNEINGVPKIQRMRVDLSHSYFDLPYRQRDCLLYLSLFPNDEINKKRLMSRWLAEGLIDEKEGKITFKDLVGRNLILQPEIKYDGDDSTYQVHRTIHDFAVWKSAKYNFITLPSAVDQTDQKKIRRISVHKNTEGCGDINLSAKKFSHLRSLSMLGPGDLPLEMSPILRVLDLEDCNNGCLKPGELFNHNLKYLKIGEGLKGFECSKLMEKHLQMPENLKSYVLATQGVKRIDSAKNLQTLDLRGFGKVTLDAAITDLVLLARLLVDPETTLPHGIMKMVALKELESINVSNYDSKFFGELAELPKLRTMGIYLYADSTSRKDEQFLTSLLKLVKKGLRSLFIDGNRNTSFPLVHPTSWGKVVENIRKFRVRCPFSATPESTNSHQHLERLRIGVPVTNLNKELSILAGFSSHLTHLYLDLSGRPQDVTTFSGAERLFPYLTCLGIRSGTLNMTVKFPRGAPEHLKLQLQADDCKEPQELPVGYTYTSVNVKTPARERNGNSQVTTTWTTVHITTPRQENHNKEVVVAINIVSKSATLSVMENEINSCIGRTNSGKGGTEQRQIKQEGKLDIINNNEIEQFLRNTTITSIQKDIAI